MSEELLGYIIPLASNAALRVSQISRNKVNALKQERNKAHNPALFALTGYELLSFDR